MKFSRPRLLGVQFENAQIGSIHAPQKANINEKIRQFTTSYKDDSSKSQN